MVGWTLASWALRCADLPRAKAGVRGCKWWSPPWSAVVWPRSTPPEFPVEPVCGASVEPRCALRLTNALNLLTGPKQWRPRTKASQSARSIRVNQPRLDAELHNRCDRAVTAPSPAPRRCRARFSRPTASRCCMCSSARVLCALLALFRSAAFVSLLPPTPRLCVSSIFPRSLAHSIVPDAPLSPEPSCNSSVRPPSRSGNSDAAFGAPSRPAPAFSSLPFCLALPSFLRACCCCSLRPHSLYTAPMAGVG